MSFADRAFSNDGGERMPPSSAGECTHRKVPRQLDEVLNLTRSINRLLEDCSIEWKASVSKKQWRMVDLKPVTQTPWQSSVVARTYFIEKDLDEAFQTLLTSKKMFTEHLAYFLALLKGEDPPQMQEPQIGNRSSGLVQMVEPRTNRVHPLDLSFMEDQNISARTRKDSVTNVQRSFTDLMKAKINFDTKFIGFHAVLNGTNCSSVDPTKCLCQICSNVLETVAEEKIINLISGPRRSKRINKTKRLTLTKRLGKRGRKLNSLNKIDQALIANENQTVTKI